MSENSNKILILFAHPLLEKSRVHKALLHAANRISGIHVHDLYEAYPLFNIDIRHEQLLLKKYDLIIWQHPVYWYSIPPLLKQWIDMVLTYGWAYGKGAEALAGKYLMQVFSSGGTAEVYSKNGHNKRPLRHYMYCHEQTAALCKLNYLPPYVVHGTHKLSDLEIHLKANEYENLLRLLQCTDLKKTDFNSYMYINDWITK